MHDVHAGILLAPRSAATRPARPCSSGDGASASRGRFVARVLATAPPADVVMARVATLRRRIEDAGRDPTGVRIVAVTKGFTSSAVDAARQAGLFDIGENYADELLGQDRVVGLWRRAHVAPRLPDATTP